MCEKKFFSPNTVFDPYYRNVQAELWPELTREQRQIVSQLFRHLKNHAQKEVAESLLAYIQRGYVPDIKDWTDVHIGSFFHLLVYRCFGKDLMNTGIQQSKA